MDPNSGLDPVSSPPVDPVAAPPATPPTPAAPSPAAPTLSVEDLTRLLADARQEAGNNRIKAKTAQDALDALNAEKLTAEERTAAELKKLREETLPGLEQKNRDLSVQVAASKLNVIDPSVAAKLLDWESVANGKTVDEALQALIATAPYLVKATGAPTPAPIAPSLTAPAAPATTGTLTFTKEQIGKMSPAEYEANRADIHAALQAHRVS